MPLGHDRPKLGFEHFHESVALGGAELLEKRARLPNLARQRLHEHAVPRPDVLLQEPRENALVCDEGGQPLRDLPVIGIEEPREDRAQGGLLLLHVKAQLAVDVGEQGGPDVLQLRLLRRRVRVLERPQADGPHVEDKLVALPPVQASKKRDALWTSVANVGGDLLGGDDERDLKVGRAVHRGHARPFPHPNVPTSMQLFRSRRIEKNRALA